MCVSQGCVPSRHTDTSLVEFVPFFCEKKRQGKPLFFGWQKKRQEKCQCGVSVVSVGFSSWTCTKPSFVSAMQYGRVSIVMQCTATDCNALQQIAMHCNRLRCTSTDCNTLQLMCAKPSVDEALKLRQCKKHPATRCNTLQHAATRCNTLQHTATHVCEGIC